MGEKISPRINTTPKENSLLETGRAWNGLVQAKTQPVPEEESAREKAIEAQQKLMDRLLEMIQQDGGLDLLKNQEIKS